METLTTAATATASLALVLVPAAKLFAIAASLFLSGINFATSHVQRPILSTLDPQHVSSSKFAELYHRGAKVVVPFSTVSGLSSALVAILSHGQAERAPWIVASICMLASLPFTRVVARETAGILQSTTGESGKAPLIDDSISDGADISGQLKRWRRMSLFRSALAVVGGILPLFTVVSRD